MYLVRCFWKKKYCQVEVLGAIILTHKVGVVFFRLNNFMEQKPDQKSVQPISGDRDNSGEMNNNANDSRRTIQNELMKDL